MAARAWWGAFAALALLALLPIWLPAVPPFFDVPNHLARATILARYDASPFYRQLFALNWRVIPNLTMDVILSTLCRIFPSLVAAKVFLSLLALGFAGGFAALHRAIHGRLSWAALAGFGLVYTLSFFMGFMNFFLGTALVLWTAAAYLSLSKAPVWMRLGVTGALLVLTFFTHLLAFLFALLFGAALAWGTERTTAKRAGIEWAFAAVVPIALFVLLSPTRGETGELLYRPWIFKIAAIVNLWRSGAVGVDALVGPMLIIGIGLLVGGSRGKLPRFALPLALACAGLFLVAPFGGKTTQVLDSRLPVFVAIAALLAVSPKAESERRSRLGYALFGAGTLVQFVGLAAFYKADEGDGRALLRAYADAPRDSYVFLGVSSDLGRRENGPYLRRHANDPGLAVVENEAYVSDLFSIASQQPLVYTERGRTLTMALPIEGSPPQPLALIAAARAKLAQLGLSGSPAYAQYAAREDVTPEAVPGAQLVLARPGLGLYRLTP